MPPSRICVGVALTSDPVATRVRLDGFCSALSAATGLDVTGSALWHYHRLLESMEMGDVDVAWLPPIIALRAAARRRITPIALPIRNGVCAYSTALFTRAASRVQSLSDLVGVRAAWVDRQSAAGYLVIRAHLKARGIDLERAFAADTFLGAHDAVARAVLDGESDVGATFVYFDEAGRSRGAGWGEAPVRILAQAGPIPSDVIATSSRVPEPVAAVVREALIRPGDAALAQAAKALLGAEAFTAPTAKHLDPLGALLQELEDGGGRPHSLLPGR